MIELGSVYKYDMMDCVTWNILMLLWLGLITNRFTVNADSSTKSNRVVFQAIALSDGVTVQCYGSCEKPADKESKFNVSRCEGRKIRFGCQSGYGIKIHLSILGRLSPELEICNPNTKLLCSQDVANKINEKCKGQTECTFDVDDTDIKAKCGSVTYLSLDITYMCEILPKTTEKEVTVMTTTPFTITDTEVSPSPILITKSLFTIPKGNDFTDPPMEQPSAKSHNKKKDLFWFMTAYTFISESRFIKENKTHLALTLLLAIFIGSVICLCFLLDHCRRVRMRRDKIRRNQQTRLENGEVGSVSDVDGDGIHLVDVPGDDTPLMNGNTPREKSIFYKVSTHHRHNNNEEEFDEDDHEESEYLIVNVSKDIPKRMVNQDNRMVNQDNRMVNQETNRETSRNKNNYKEPKKRTIKIISPPESCHSGPPSPLSLPPPPNDFLENLSASSNELFPPPSQFQAEVNKVPSLVITSPSPTGSSTNTVIARRPTEKSFSEEDHRPFKRRAAYPKTVQLPRKGIARNNSVKETNKYLVSPNVRFALHRRSVSAETLHKIATSSVENNNYKCKKKLNRELSLDNETSKRIERNKPSSFQPIEHGRTRVHRSHTQQDSVQSINRGSRKSKVHAIKSSSGDEKLVINRDSPSILTVPKHPCGSKHNHPCICIPSRTNTGGYMCSCTVKLKQGIKSCCLNETCNYKNMTTFTKEDVLEDKMSYIDRNVEESGYQSHDTDCSSGRSTDQEDSLIFSPNRNSPVLQITNKHKTLRRARRSDNRPSESSMEDDSCSRDSIKVVRKTKHKKRENLEHSSKRFDNGMKTSSSPRVSKEGHVVVREGILKNGGINY